MKRLGLLEWVVAAFMVALVAIVFAQVLLRYLTYQPLAWTEEVARYAFIWLCLLGAGVAARRGQHFAVDLIVRRVPEGSRRWLIATMLALEAVFYLLVAWAGIGMLAIVGRQHSPTLDIPMSVPYLAIPVGAALMAGFAAWRAYAAATARAG